MNANFYPGALLGLVVLLILAKVLEEYSHLLFGHGVMCCDSTGTLTKSRDEWGKVGDSQDKCHQSLNDMKSEVV